MSFKSFVCFGIVLLLNVIAAAKSFSQERRIYIANDDHTDLMWTADEETYARSFVEMIDWHMSLSEQTSELPTQFQHKFNCDGSYWLWCYEQKKTAQEMSGVIDSLKKGTLSAPLNAVVSCYGGQSVEAVLRGMYYPGRLERKHDLRFHLAVAMENQTISLGLASLFSGAGAKYSWRGICGCATQMNSNSFDNRESEIYWWTGHDGQRILMKWHSLVSPGNRQSGGYAEAFDPAAAIRFLDSDPDFLKRYRGESMDRPYDVRAAFGFGWDALDRKTEQAYAADPKTYPATQHFHVVAQKCSDDERKIIVSNEMDFFVDFESHYGDDLESQSLTFGNEWDLYSASLSETSAQVKRSVEKLRAAELLASMVSLKEPDFMKRHQSARDQAFINLGLYWEHNWTADGPISRARRAAWQNRLANQIDSYVDELHIDATERMGRLIAWSDRRSADEQRLSKRFFVLNPLGWPRSETADYLYDGSRNLRVIDLTTGQPVKHQWVQRMGKTFLRVHVSDVPAAGYKVMEIQDVSEGIANERNVAGTADINVIRNEAAWVFENSKIKIEIDPDGAIRSLVDKSSHPRELAKNIDGLWINDFAANSNQGEPLSVVNSGPVSVTVLAKSSAGLDHTTAITLYADSNRIDIENTLEKNFGDVRHWSFSFDLDQPLVHSEEVGAINLNKLATDNGDYANTNARYDYITVNHFADVTRASGDSGVTLSSPDLSFAKLGKSTPASLDTQTPQLHVLAGGQVDGDQLGIPSQGGNRTFHQRFALKPHAAYDAVSAMKFALEHQNPLVTGTIDGTAGDESQEHYPETDFSLIRISNPSVLLWALKPHDDGIEQGLVARMWNVSEADATSNLTLAGEVKTAYRTTHIETDIEAVALNRPVETNEDKKKHCLTTELKASFSRQQIQTYRFLIK
jgi:alpha-mannosidase